MDAADELDSGMPLLMLLNRRSRWLSEALVARLEAAGVGPMTPAHALVLAHLGRDSPMSIAELARQAGVTRQTMHAAVSQLVDEGLLTRETGPGFPRSTLIGLTDAGRRRLEVAREILDDLERSVAAAVGEPAMTHLRAALAQAWPS